MVPNPPKLLTFTLLGHCENLFSVVSNWIRNNYNTLPDILRSKCNQTMKIGQLLEYNKRSIFLEKSCTKCGSETNPRPSLKRQN